MIHREFPAVRERRLKDFRNKRHELFRCSKEEVVFQDEFISSTYVLKLSSRQYMYILEEESARFRKKLVHRKSADELLRRKNKPFKHSVCSRTPARCHAWIGGAVASRRSPKNEDKSDGENTGNEWMTSNVNTENLDESANEW